MQAKLDEQLLMWEQHWRAGTPVSPESLCADCPELLPALRERIAAILSLASMLESSQGSDSTVDSQDHRESATPPVSGNVRTESQYTLLGHHARGGLGEVLLAKDETLQRNVAVKRMRRPWQVDASRRTRFLREAAITGQLEHPGIVPVHSLGHDPDSGPYYSMRFIEGETLQQAIHKLHDELAASGEPLVRSRTLQQLLGHRSVARESRSGTRLCRKRDAGSDARIVPLIQPSTESVETECHTKNSIRSSHRDRGLVRLRASLGSSPTSRVRLFKV